MKRFIRLLVIFVFTLIFSLGFSFIRFFAPGSYGAANTGYSIKSFAAIHYQQPELPSRSSLISTIEDEQDSKSAFVAVQPLLHLTLYTIAFHFLSALSKESRLYPLAALDAHLSRASSEPLFVQHCLYRI